MAGVVRQEGGVAMARKVYVAVRVWLWKVWV